MSPPIRSAQPPPPPTTISDPHHLLCLSPCSCLNNSSGLPGSLSGLIRAGCPLNHQSCSQANRLCTIVSSSPCPLWTQMKGHSAPHEFGCLEQPPKRLGDTTWKYRDSNYPWANPDQWETGEGRHRKTNSSSPSLFTSFHRSPTQWDTMA